MAGEDGEQRTGMAPIPEQIEESSAGNPFISPTDDANFEMEQMGEFSSAIPESTFLQMSAEMEEEEEQMLLSSPTQHSAPTTGERSPTTKSPPSMPPMAPPLAQEAPPWLWH